MLNKKAQQSLLDMLFQVMPELRDKLSRPSGVQTNSSAAKALYAIWSKEENKVSGHKFRCPPTVARSDVRTLETEGLVTASGDNVVITAKGGEVLKQMILGDDRSAFDMDDEPIDYIKAVANTKPSRRKSGNKIASVIDTPLKGTNWYEQSKRSL